MLRVSRVTRAPHRAWHMRKTQMAVRASLILLLTGVLTTAVRAQSAGASANPRAKIGAEIWREQAVKQRIDARVGVRTASGRELLLRAGLASRAAERAQVAIYYREKPEVAELQRLEGLGGRVNPGLWIPPVPGKHPYGYVVAEVSYAQLLSAADAQNVVAIRSVEGALKPQNDLAAEQIHADVVREALPTTYDGAGVSIAVLDSSLDVDHPDIPTPVEAYDVTDGAGIANWSTDVSSTVSDHGTHVVGSALGRGTASGGRYQGIAPGASLYFYKIGNDVDASATWEDMAEAFARAAELHVNIATMSYGGWSYFMDGSEAGSQAVDAAVAAGTVVFVSAGNEQNKDQHDSAPLIAAGSVNTGLDIRIDNTSGGAAYVEDVYINVVRKDSVGTDDNLTLSITNLDLTETLATDSYATSLRGTESTVYRLTPDVPAGLSKIYAVVLTNSASYSLTAHLYLFADGNVTFTSADPGSTVTEPALADSAIAVGAWVSRGWWWDWLGNLWTYYYVWDTLAPFSSLGPRVDGLMKPDLCAPGASIISCRDFDLPPPPSWALIDSDSSNNGDGPTDYTVKDGTSMASPMTAGAAALLLEAYPSLSPDQVKRVLSSTAANASMPDNQVGAGLINILAAVATDCNSNSFPDVLDLSEGNSPDCDANGQPDECGPRVTGDCDCSALVDLMDYVHFALCMAGPTVAPVAPFCTCVDFDRDHDVDLRDYALFQQVLYFTDCNSNGLHDRLDVFYGLSLDCNANGVPDGCDIAGGTSLDTDGNGIPDECTDCNRNGINDLADIALGTSHDCNTDHVPDECEPDCNANGTPDDCDMATGAFVDCNSNGVIDSCEPDCNWNGIPDACDLALGTATDADGDGLPDECIRVVIYTAAGASGLNNGTSWPNAYVDLQSALAKCTALRGTGVTAELWIAAGTYRPDSGTADRTRTFQLHRGLEMYGGFAGWEARRSQRRPDLYASVLSGDLLNNDGPEFSNYGDNSYHVVTGSGTNATTVFDGFTVRGGCANGSSLANSGGGLLNITGSPLIRNCTFVANFADEGGAINNQSGSNPSVRDTLFVGNKAVDGGGAALNATGCSAEFLRCRFEGNSAELGGALANVECAAIADSCTFVSNNATGTGGAVFNAGAGSPLLRNCLLVANESYGGGGAVQTHGPGGPPDSRLLNCTLAWNSTASNMGGGIAQDNYTIAHVTNCILWGNSAMGQTGTLAQISGNAVVAYSCVEGGIAGVGNMSSAPLFATGPLGEFYLSQTAAGQGQESPCIDTADPASAPVGGTTRTDGIGDTPPLDIGFHYTMSDCNGDVVPDALDIAGGTSADCDTNGVPDECEADCNGNGMMDTCEISSGTAQDCDRNNVPDACDADCNSNGVPDACDLVGGTSLDCNENGTPDTCDVGSGASGDIDSNGIPDECQPAITFLYWADVGATRLERSALDGSGRVVVNSSTFSRGLVSDTRFDRLYFLNVSDPGQIRRSQLDGSGVAVVLSGITADADGLALDVTNERLLWCRRSETAGAIYRVNTDGTQYGTLIGGQFAPKSVTVDTVNQHVYWIFQAGVKRANLDGSAVATVISWPDEPAVYDIAVDPVAQHIYWSIRNVGSPVSLAKIRRCNYDGAGSVNLIAGLDSKYEIPIALDKPGGKIYWYESTAKRIRRAELDGTAIENVVSSGLVSVTRLAVYRKTAAP